MLQHHHSAHYNYLDELASLDQQMYSSLNFIKVCSQDSGIKQVLVVAWA